MLMDFLNAWKKVFRPLRGILKNMESQITLRRLSSGAMPLKLTPSQRPASR